jgi:large subunit ribosomal protein L9
MPSHLHVVLREDVDNLGHTGDLVKVRPGYARNFLLPRGLAVAATRANVAQIEHEKRLAAKRADRLREEASGLAAALAEVTLDIPKPTGEEGKLYGSVTANDIADMLKGKGYDVDKRKIQLPKEPIKSVGTYEVGAKLGPGITQTFKINVMSE